MHDYALRYAPSLALLDVVSAAEPRAVDGASALILIGLVIAYAAAGGTSFDLAHLAGVHYSPALQAWAFLVLFLGFSVLAGSP